MSQDPPHGWEPPSPQPGPGSQPPPPSYGAQPPPRRTAPSRHPQYGAYAPAAAAVGLRAAAAAVGVRPAAAAVRGTRQPPAPPKPGVVPLRPLGLGEILDGAVQTIRLNPKVMLGLSAIVNLALHRHRRTDRARQPARRRSAASTPWTAARTRPRPTSASSSASLVGSVLQFVGTTVLTGLL